MAEDIISPQKGKLDFDEETSKGEEKQIKITSLIKSFLGKFY